MILMEEANHPIGLVDLHMAVGLWSFNVSTGLALKSAHVLIGLRREKETAGQGNIGERVNYCRLATSVDCSSGRNR